METQSYVIETMMSDGPHWYSGIGTMEFTNDKGEQKTIQSPMWSPYWQDRKVLTITQANLHLGVAIQNMAGAKIVHQSDALTNDSRRFIDEKEYEMRGCYLQLNMLCIIPGYTAKMQVVKVTDTEIKLKNYSSAAAFTYLGKSTEKWVRVVGMAEPKPAKKERLK